MITDVFLNQKRENKCEHMVQMVTQEIVLKGGLRERKVGGEEGMEGELMEII